MPYKDPEKAREASRIRQERYRNKPEKREKLRAAHRSWYQNNRESAIEYRKKYSKRKTEERNRTKPPKEPFNKQEYQRQYRKGKEEKAGTYHAEWRAKNKEYLREYLARYRQEHREELRRNFKKWREAHPEEARLHSKTSVNKPRKLELQRMRYHARPEIRAAQIAKAKRRYAEKTPEERMADHRRHQLKRYGITPQEWEERFDKQGRRCPICKSDKSAEGKAFHVDHCHESSRVRGILCHHCNLMLGNARDNVTILEAAIRYLKEGSQCE